MKRFKFFIFNTSFLIVTSLIFRGIDIYFTGYISKKIGTEQMGLFGLIMSVYLFGITLATSGINLAVTRVISEELAVDNLGRRKKSYEKMFIHNFNHKYFYQLYLLGKYWFYCRKVLTK